MFPGCYGDGKPKVETCLACGDPTGRAGKGEDSIYAGDVGPFCEQCWADILLWVETDRDVNIARLTKQLATAEALLREACESSATILPNDWYQRAQAAGGE